jgi:hypothetical protein
MGLRAGFVREWTQHRTSAEWYSVGLRAGRGVRVPAEAGNFSLHHRVKTGSGTNPASYSVGTGESFSLGVRRPVRKADHSPQEYVQVTPTTPIRLRGVMLS